MGIEGKLLHVLLDRQRMNHRDRVADLRVDILYDFMRRSNQPHTLISTISLLKSKGLLEKALT